MTEINAFLSFLDEGKVSDIKIYKDFQESNCIICTATSSRHINSLMNKIKSMKLLSKNAMTGFNTGWGILTFETFDCHLFIQEQREYYDLDGLWGKNGRI